jgi:hypothetical protein
MKCSEILQKTREYVLYKEDARRQGQEVQEKNVMVLHTSSAGTRFTYRSYHVQSAAVLAFRDAVTCLSVVLCGGTDYPFG